MAGIVALAHVDRNEWTAIVLPEPNIVVVPVELASIPIKSFWAAFWTLFPLTSINLNILKIALFSNTGTFPS